MTRKKRHSAAEIAAKLAQAEELAAQGKLQSEICRDLGVSVMTLHRWRKLPSDQLQSGSTRHPGPDVSNFDAALESDRIGELKLENSRLRRLVTDLMLEKIALQEAQNDRSLRRNTKR